MRSEGNNCRRVVSCGPPKVASVYTRTIGARAWLIIPLTLGVYSLLGNEGIDSQGIEFGQFGILTAWYYKAKAVFSSIRLRGLALQFGCDVDARSFIGRLCESW